MQNIIPYMQTLLNILYKVDNKHYFIRNDYMQYTTLHDIKRVITSFENSINKASNKANANNKANNTSNASKDLLVSDSTCRGLYLYLRQNKQGISKAFIFKYKSSNRIYKLTIGQYPHISLDKARDITTQYNSILQSLEYKEKGLSLKDYLQYMQDKDKNTKLTFKHVFTEWIEKQSIRETTKKQYKHQSKPLLKVFGNKLIQDITKNDIVEFLQGYQVRGKIAICYQLYRMLRRVFDYCIAYDYIEYSVCDRIKYKIIFKLPIVKHHKAILEKDLKDFVIYSNKALFNDVDIHSHNNISKTTRYLTLNYRLFAIMYKFNMYMPLRIHNIISLEWSDIDFKNKMLVIPAYKMKLNKEFKLPLSSQALEILEFIYKQRLDKYVFSCALSDKVRMQRAFYNALNEYIQLQKQGLITENTQRKLANKYLLSYSSLRDLIHKYKKDNTIKDKYKKFIDNALHKHTKYKAYTKFLTTHKLNTPHRIRSTFSTILYDLTPKHKLDFSIIEMCLSHSVGNMVIQSYNHSERMQERLELMQFWADYIDKLAHENTLQQVVNNSDLYMFNPADDNAEDNDTLRF